MVRKMSVWMLAAALAAVVVLPAVAAGPGEEGRRGREGSREGRRGRGRRDGGARREMSPEERMVRLLREEEVRLDLGLTPEQEAALQELDEQRRQVFDRARQEMEAARQPAEAGAEGRREEGRRGGFRGGGEAFARAREEANELSRQALDVLAEAQRTTLQKLADMRHEEETRRRSLWSLADEQTAAEVGLSEEQRNQIRDILRENSTQMRSLGREAMEGLRDLPPEQRRQRMRDLWREQAAVREQMQAEAEQAVMQALTPEQRTAFGAFVQERVKAARGRTITVTRRRPEGGATAPRDTGEPAPEEAEP